MQASQARIHVLWFEKVLDLLGSIVTFHSIKKAWVKLKEEADWQ